MKKSYGGFVIVEVVEIGESRGIKFFMPLASKFCDLLNLTKPRIIVLFDGFGEVERAKSSILASRVLPLCTYILPNVHNPSLLKFLWTYKSVQVYCSYRDIQTQI